MRARRNRRVGGGRVAPSIPDPNTPVTCPGVRTHRRSTPRPGRAAAGGPSPGIRRQPRITRARPAAGADSRETRRLATDGPPHAVSPRLVTVPARRWGTHQPGMARRGHPPIMGGPGRLGSQPAATSGPAHQGSRHLGGPAAPGRRRVVTAVPVYWATGPAATTAPPPPAMCPATPGPRRRARPPLVRDGKPTPAWAGGVTRQPLRADRMIPDGIPADVMRVVDASRAPGVAAGPPCLVRSPAGLAWTAT